MLYLGDTTLKGDASYLAGVMNYHHINFSYLASDQQCSHSLLDGDYTAIIISDYPSRNFSTSQLNSMGDSIGEGLGLLMIGGWESFTGANHEYTETILKDILPVVMSASDDRVNCSGPCLVEKARQHPIVNSLPFEKNTPVIGGFNRLQSKPEGNTILCARRFNVAFIDENFMFEPVEKPDPLLVVGNYGKGRICAFATDTAPHWVGGLVDWGDSRIEAQAPGANRVEVGNSYAELFANMIKWTMGEV